MSEKKGLIFDIQGFSVHDGPGSRTTVFLSGCPLHCRWCANPEGRELCQQVLFSCQKCRHDKDGCERCKKACTKGALEFMDGKLIQDREICRECTTFDCTKVCVQEALRLSGKWYSVEDIMNILRRDRRYWENGGVTFSGGDPLLQRDFLLEVLKKCKQESIHTVIETSAYAKTSDFLEIISYIDLAFVDVKNMDTVQHRNETGVDNHLILQNISKIYSLGWKGRIILRMPVIKEYNDSEYNIDAVIQYMIKNQLFEINILPFHRMGTTKWTQLGLEYPYKNMLPTEPELLEKIQRMFLDSNIACYVGDDIIY